jgi:FkbM family methyltransferase
VRLRALRSARRPAGLDATRLRLARERAVDVVLDVGANEGLFGLRLRRLGYRGRIVSFEPLSQAFAKLEAASAEDPAWECRRLALGARSGTATLNVAANWASSSLLAQDPRLPAIEPRTAYVGAEECTVTTLDELRGEVLRPGERTYVKVDVQGLELDVLRGGEATLEQVELLDVELSLVPLYEGAPLLGEVVRHLDERRFGLVALEPAFADPATGAILQLDGLFARLAK